MKRPGRMPPRLARALVRLLIPREIHEEVDGDLMERFQEIHVEKGPYLARAWYWRQILAIRPWALRSAVRQLNRGGGPPKNGIQTMNGFLIWLAGCLGDTRFAVRSLLRSPLHAVMTVAVLAIGIGAVTLMFSALNASVLRPLPFPEGDELVWVWKSSEEAPENSLSYDDFVDYRAGVPAFENLAAFFVFRPYVLVTGLEEATRIRSTLVTPTFFETVGILPAMGRCFTEEEAVLGGPQVVVVSDDYWQGRLGADPEIIGKSIILDGEPTEVVGVMPPGFQFRSSVDLWMPARAGAGYATGRGNNNFFMVGRLGEGVSFTQAQTQVEAVGLRIQEANPDFSQWSHRLEPLHETFFGDVRPMLLILMGIVSLVPLVACANVASLILARATTRSTELATRFALGAGRGRVVRQLVAENVLLAAVGGVLGIGIAHAGGRLLRTYGPASIPRLDEIGLDADVLLFALLVAVVLVPFFGVFPALKGTRMNLVDGLRSGGRGGGDVRGRARRVLVISQVALSTALLVTSALFLRSFQRLQSVDPGFEVRSILTAGIQIPEHKYGSPEELQVVWDETMARLSATPGVSSLAVADWLPVVSGGGPWNGLSRPDRPLPDDRPYLPATRKFISRDYFSVLDVRILTGRAFGPDDRVGTPDVIILSEPLARTLFPGENPLGKAVTLWDRPFEVVGVAEDIPEAGLGESLARPTFFLSNDQFPSASMRLLVRAGGADPASLTGSLRIALGEVDRDIALTSVQTMEAGISGTLAQPRFQTGLVAAFALVGLLMAAFGIYGVLAYLVTRRTREIGIRMAVGAEGGDVLRLVLKEGMGMVGVGAVVGLAAGGGISLLIRGLLVGVSPADPMALAASGTILVLVALAASLGPAVRALRTDALTALRAE